MANINITDFNLFFSALKALQRIVDAAKFIVSENGLEIYGARGSGSAGAVARCELTTNAISSSDEPFEFCVDNLSMFNKILSTVKDIHKDDMTSLSIIYSKPNINFKSKKFKMKYSTCKESIISNWVSKKIETKMDSVFQFSTSSDFIKLVNNHAFLFQDSSSVNVYIETKDDMELNSVFATLGNKNIDIGKEITFKFGIVTSGTIPENRKIIIDLERLNLFNCFQNMSDIQIDLMNLNCLLCQLKEYGKNNSYSNLNIYSSLLKDI